jgi:hypothetical protein
MTAARTMELADEIAGALIAFSQAPYGERDKARAEVHRVLWDKKADIIAALRGVGGNAREPTPQMIAAAQQAIMAHPHYTFNSTATAFGFANAALKAALASLPSSEPARETEHRDALLAALSALNNPLNMSLRDRAFGAINRALYTLSRPERRDLAAVHLSHCNQGEHEGTCKYGEDETCPAMTRPHSNTPEK